MYFFLEEYCPSLHIVGTATSKQDGLQLLSANNCDLAFLDIQLKDGLSFEMLDLLQNWDFSIIFTTAYSDYTIEAFRVEAVDYLLKPYTPKQVIKAVDKVKARKE